MPHAPEPQLTLARKILPKGLLRAIQHIFDQGVSGATLVGGTALAGFYAGHRQSDDINLFTRDTEAQRSATLAAASLIEDGASIVSRGQKTPQYFNLVIAMDRHHFTIDIVLDANFYRVASQEMAGNIAVATLKDILRMKMATIVSRCSEKDLYDLQWLFKHFKTMSLEEKFRLGCEIDAGLNWEAALASLASATLDRGACGFAERQGKDADHVFACISEFKTELAKSIMRTLDAKGATGSLAKVLAQIKKT